MKSILNVKASKLAPINRNTVIPGITETTANQEDKSEKYDTVSGVTEQGKDKENG